MTYTTADKLGDDWGGSLESSFGPMDAAAATAAWGTSLSFDERRRSKREDASSFAADKGQTVPQGVPVAVPGDWHVTSPRAASCVAAVERAVDIALFALAVGLVVAYAIVIIVTSL